MTFLTRIKLNNAEREIMQHLIDIYQCSEATAFNEIVKYKRELALHHQHRGNFELAKHLLIELDEWDDSREQDFKNSKLPSSRKIILPGDK